jgi:hypothetical protein
MAKRLTGKTVAHAVISKVGFLEVSMCILGARARREAPEQGPAAKHGGATGAEAETGRNQTGNSAGRF